LSRLNFDSWFVRSRQPIKDPAKKKELVGFLLDVVLAFVFGVAEMPVIYKWLGWLMCFGILLYIVQSSVDQIKWLPIKTRMVGAILIMSCFIAIFWNSACDMWMEEQSAKLEGDLIGAGSAAPRDATHQTYPITQVGGTQFISVPGGTPTVFAPFPDANVKVEWGTKGWPVFSTTIRDRNGNMVAKVTESHWKVYPTGSSADKNYKSNALEILDSAGHVVLQVKIEKDRVILQGEWWDTQGYGLRLLNAHPGQNGGSIADRLTRQEQHLNDLIEPMFVYPSKKHWRETISQ
jgi:hypothetical protein